MRIRQSVSGIGRLAAVWLLVAIAWLGVLPAIATRPLVKARLDELDARGIDPSAMYYSELPAMDEVQVRFARFHREHADALWVP